MKKFNTAKKYSHARSVNGITKNYIEKVT